MGAIDLLLAVSDNVDSGECGVFVLFTRNAFNKAFCVAGIVALFASAKDKQQGNYRCSKHQSILLSIVYFLSARCMERFASRSLELSRLS